MAEAKTKKTFRIEDSLIATAEQYATENGITFTDAVVEAIQLLVCKNENKDSNDTAIDDKEDNDKDKDKVAIVSNTSATSSQSTSQMMANIDSIKKEIFFIDFNVQILINAMNAILLHLKIDTPSQDSFSDVLVKASENVKKSIRTNKQRKDNGKDNA